MNNNVTLPNPGSPEAVARGCICAIRDNGSGRGARGGTLVDGQKVFVTEDDCPLHGSDDLVVIHLRTDFAESVVYSYSGGVNELHIGGICTSEAAAAGVKRKIDAALAAGEFEAVPDITIRLTEVEAMCLAVASQNCQTATLPSAQLARLEEWFERWKADNPE